MLHPPLTANAKLRKRFQREAEISSTLKHRNVVGVVDIGETEHLVYLAMELAEGTPLSTIIHEAPLPPTRVIEYARQLCDGLQHAHGAGLIHRDFKPENVIVERDAAGTSTLRIIDFGIAMLRDGSPGDRERLTTEGIVLGTPHYMAPEHASGEDVDHRIDLFALGVICFEMLTGKMPFDGDGVDVARSNIMCDVPVMADRVPYLNVDPLLEAFTRRLMERERDRRFASAKAAREVLDLIANDRHAAAFALGLEEARNARLLSRDQAVGTIPPPLARQVLAMPAMTRSRSAPNTLEPGVRATLPAEPEPTFETEQMPPAPARTAEPAPPAALEPVVEPRPTPVVVPAQRPPVTPKPRVAAQAPRRTAETPNQAIPTAVEVADLYGVVGRSLGQLQQAKGSDATIDLWPRFRHIRINDGIASPEARRETRRILHDLKRDVDARR